MALYYFEILSAHLEKQLRFVLLEPDYQSFSSSSNKTWIKNIQFSIR